MKNCPDCFEKLEPKEVTPCFVCGGWGLTDSEEFPTYFTKYTYHEGKVLIICQKCFLEEFLAKQGTCCEYINAEENDLSISPDIIKKEKIIDKYCVNCCKRLALLKLKREDNPTLD